MKESDELLANMAMGIDSVATLLGRGFYVLSEEDFIKTIKRTLCGSDTVGERFYDHENNSYIIFVLKEDYEEVARTLFKNKTKYWIGKYKRLLSKRLAKP